MTDEQFIMAIDQGTTSTRAIIFNKRGEIVKIAQHELPQIFPHSGWVEHDANIIWATVQQVIADVLIQANIKPFKIASIGITNQRETTVIWDRVTGEPVYNAIVWQSKQTAEIADNLKAAGYTKVIHQKTGLVIDSYFSATKIMWILDNIPGVRQRAERGELMFGTIDTWILYKLTNGHKHATDYSNASRTMLFNINTLEWDDELLELFNIPRSLLPEVKPSSGQFGYTQDYGFYGIKVPITGIAGDQHAALFGQAAFEPGMVKNTYGTGAFIMLNTGKSPKYSDNGLLTTIAYGLDGEVTYALEGSVFAAGAAIQWLRDGMQLVERASDTDELATKANSDDNVYVIPAFTGLGAPYWDQDMRGAVFGLTRATTKEQFVRATVESLAYQTRDVITTMVADTDLPITALAVDGGASNNDYLMQFQADILACDIKRPIITETTALGVAFLAGLAVGFWQDQAELKQMWQLRDTFTSQMPPTVRARKYAGWQMAVKAAQAFKN
ncbi:glycerol kinase GlpK [Periweissella fabalis]|uniref:Glycerol kinase n=1 Tax=Periweissella fabalis TaxID=1070421 RepID=A0A7X6S273_9LACO|nr:glycerol kinase GlpK [Periweissella fabalis]MCM0598988.1 glycerol kinase GlpK [Periweissella fabalis]NKZ23268.1 glycerol kinase GlpK [Periweissella fabalis]